MVVRIFSFFVAMVLAGGAWGQLRSEAELSPVRLHPEQVIMQTRLMVGMEWPEASEVLRSSHWVPSSAHRTPPLGEVGGDLVAATLTDSTVSHELHFVSAFYGSFRPETMAVFLCNGTVWRVERFSPFVSLGTLRAIEEFAAHLNWLPVEAEVIQDGDGEHRSILRFHQTRRYGPGQFEARYQGVTTGTTAATELPPNFYRSFTNGVLFAPCENPETPVVE